MEMGKPMGRAPIMKDLGFTEDERREIVNVALNLRSMRFSHRDIATRLGVREPTVAKWIKEALQEQIKNLAYDPKELIQLELNELDHLQAILAPNAEEGQLGSIDRILKIMESRRRLLGIDKPESHDINVSVRQIVGVDPDDI